jgi:hypothetical protein
LKDHFHSTAYIVVTANIDQGLYEIRLAQGGPTKWVNRKMLVPDPRAGLGNLAVSDSDTEIFPIYDAETDISDSSETEEFPMWTFEYVPEVPDDPPAYAPVLHDPPPDVEVEPTQIIRRSARLTKGVHTNVFKDPKSVLERT